MDLSLEPSNTLESALREAAQDPSCLPWFFDELLRAEVFVMTVQGEEGKLGGLSFGSIMVEARKFIPFFTSRIRVPEDRKCVPINCRELFVHTRGSNLIMNPAIFFGKQFFPDEIERLLSRDVFAPKQELRPTVGEPVLIRECPERPEKLVEALSLFFIDVPEVKRAWIASYRNPKSDPNEGFLLALDLSDSQALHRVAGQTGIIVENVAEPRTRVDIVRYSGAGVTSYFDTRKPFYKR